MDFLRYSRWVAGPCLIGSVILGGGCFSDSMPDPGPDAADTGNDTLGGTGASTSGAGEGETTQAVAMSTGDAGSAAASDDAGASWDGTGGTGGSDGTDGTNGTDGSGDATIGSTTGDESTGETVLGIDDLEPGALVITEVMFNPLCPSDVCEWIELYNATTSIINLLDLRVADDNYPAGVNGRITDDAMLAPGEYGVITRATSSWPYAFEAIATYGPNPIFDNGQPDQVVIHDDAGAVLDQTPSLPFTAPPGTAWAFIGAAITDVDNDDPAQWCLSADPLASTDGVEFGSPQTVNDLCSL